MANGEILTSTSTKFLRLQPKHFFVRPFTAGSWTDITIVVCVGFAKNTIAFGAGSPGYWSGTWTNGLNVMTDHYFLGLKTPGAGMVGDSGVDFWGVTTPAFGSTGNWTGITNEAYMGAPGAGVAYKTALGRRNGGTTYGLSDGDYGNDGVNNATSKQPYFWNNSHSTDPDRAQWHGVRIRIDSSTNISLAVSHNDTGSAHTTGNQPTISEASTFNSNRILSVTPKSINIGDTSSPPGAIFFYMPITGWDMTMKFYGIIKNA